MQIGTNVCIVQHQNFTQIDRVHMPVSVYTYITRYTRACIRKSSRSGGEYVDANVFLILIAIIRCKYMAKIYFCEMIIVTVFLQLKMKFKHLLKLCRMCRRVCRICDSEKFFFLFNSRSCHTEIFVSCVPHTHIPFVTSNIIRQDRNV